MRFEKPFSKLLMISLLRRCGSPPITNSFFLILVIARLRLRAETDVDVFESIIIKRYESVIGQSVADRNVMGYNDLPV